MQENSPIGQQYIIERDKSHSTATGEVVPAQSLHAESLGDRGTAVAGGTDPTNTKPHKTA